MTDTAHSVAAAGVAPLETARLLAEIEKGQQLAGHFPDAEALERARRVATGEITAAAAYAELNAKYSRG